jgi:uncharacterized surface protein with fasciclin (FAS1) repeats
MTYKSFQYKITKLSSLLMVMAMSIFASCTREDLSIIPPTVFDRIAADSELSTFARAIEKAGLKNTLQGQIFTAFAPTNAAFTASEINIDQVDAAVLNRILRYHFVAQRIDSARLSPLYTINFLGILDNLNLAGFQTLNFSVTNGFIYLTHRNPNVPNIVGSDNNLIEPNGVLAINGIPVTRMNAISSSNGVIHKIGRVLLPPSGIIPLITANNPQLSLFDRAIRRAATAPGAISFADNISELSSLPTPAQAPSAAAANRAIFRTVFAPSNTAMEAAGYNAAAIDAATPAALLSIVQAHVITGRNFSTDFRQTAPTATINTFVTRRASTSLNVDLTPNASPTVGLVVGGVPSANPRANISVANIYASNGVIHIIDRVLQ